MSLSQVVDRSRLVVASGSCVAIVRVMATMPSVATAPVDDTGIWAGTCETSVEALALVTPVLEMLLGVDS